MRKGVGTEMLLVWGMYIFVTDKCTNNLASRYENCGSDFLKVMDNTVAAFWQKKSVESK